MNTPKGEAKVESKDEGEGKKGVTTLRAEGAEQGIVTPSRAA